MSKIVWTRHPLHALQQLPELWCPTVSPSYLRALPRSSTTMAAVMSANFKCPSCSFHQMSRPRCLAFLRLLLCEVPGNRCGNCASACVRAAKVAPRSSRLRQSWPNAPPGDVLGSSSCELGTGPCGLGQGDTRTVAFGTLANRRHGIASRHCVLTHSVRLDNTPTSRDAGPAVCQGHSATPDAVAEVLDLAGALSGRWVTDYSDPE